MESDMSILTCNSPLSHNALNALRHTRYSLLCISHLLSSEKLGRSDVRAFLLSTIPALKNAQGLLVTETVKYCNGVFRCALKKNSGGS